MTLRYVADKTIADLAILKKDFEALEKVSQDENAVLEYARDNILFLQKEIVAIDSL